VPENDELQDQRDRLDEKREELEALKAARVDAVNSVAGELEKAQLDVEEQRLDAEIEAAKAGSNLEDIRAGNAQNLASAKAQMQAAVATEKPAEKPANGNSTPPASTGQPANGNGDKGGK
jgi:cell division septation protein DedD